MNKIVTLARKPELEEKFVVLQCIYTDKNTALSPEDIDTSEELHRKRPRHLLGG